MKDYNYILDREWRAITRGDSSSDDNDDERCDSKKQLKLKKSLKTSANKMQDNNSQCHSSPLPVQPSSPNSVQWQLKQPVEQPPATQDVPLSAEEQAVLAARAARSKVLNAELEKVFMEAPDPFYPVPEEFMIMLGQLNFTNEEPSQNQCTPIPEPKVQFSNDTTDFGYYENQQTTYKSDFEPLPHTIVPNCRPVQEQYNYDYQEPEYIPESPQGYSNVNELCQPMMTEQDPCEGSSASYNYMAQECMPMQYQGMPTLYQQEQYDYNGEKSDHFMNHMHLADQVPQMLQNMQAHNMPVHMPMHAMPHTPTLRQLLSPPKPQSVPPLQPSTEIILPKKESPRELRNRAEKQRRDKLNQSIALLARIVPPVAAMGRKIDKTTIMKLTAHYLRSHQYGDWVRLFYRETGWSKEFIDPSQWSKPPLRISGNIFGNSINNGRRFKVESTNAVLSLLKGFVLTVTYRGLIVVVSHNIRQLLGYSELDLIGTNVYSIIHDQDHDTFRDHIMPTSVILGKHGELLIPDEPNGTDDVAKALAKEKRTFVVRFKKLVHRSEAPKYMMCHVEGSFRKADKACRYLNRCCQLVRRARARGENPRSSGNDIVFIGVVRPLADTFMSESIMESFRMEYRTRHSVDGEIIQCEQRIALVTGYMTDEVSGINAMNFMHRDDVRWVIVALREMYDQHRLFGESCYRLMAKNGEFVYMRSRGRLDVDETSKIATSFVCTNTVVSEEEGKHFINLMKKRFNILVNNGANSIFTRDENDSYNDNSLPVEDPRQLEKVILHLVTNLPSPITSDQDSRYKRISIIPPKKERIVNAIKRIENVLHPRVIASMDPKKEIDRIDENSTSPDFINDEENIETQGQLQAYGMPHNTDEAFRMLENHEQSLSNLQPQSFITNEYSTNNLPNYVGYPIPNFPCNTQFPADNETTEMYMCNWEATLRNINVFASQPSTSIAMDADETTQANSSTDDEHSYAMSSSTGELINSDDIDLDRLTPYLYDFDSLSSDSTDIGRFFISQGEAMESKPILLCQRHQLQLENQNNTVSQTSELGPLVLDSALLDTTDPSYNNSKGSLAVDTYIAHNQLFKQHKTEILEKWTQWKINKVMEQTQEAAANINQKRTCKRRRIDTGEFQVVGNRQSDSNEVVSSTPNNNNTTGRSITKTPKGKGVGKRTK